MLQYLGRRKNKELIKLLINEQAAGTKNYEHLIAEIKVIEALEDRINTGKFN